MALNRRQIFAASAGLAAAASGSTAHGAALSEHTLTVQMRRSCGTWEVCMPALEYMNAWFPGMPFPIKWVTLQEYLSEVESILRDKV